MDHFQYKSGELYAESVAITDIASQVGTPFYCYSSATARRHVQVFRDALSALNPMICFAVKANSNIQFLRVLAEQGVGADVVSEGEIRLALAAGIPADQIVFSGVGKKRSEMRFALERGVFQFNVESEQELLVLNDEAGKLGKVAPIALRVNPDVDAGTHEKITTGRKDSKFGIDIAYAPTLYALAASLDSIQIQGVSVHIGSQLTQLEPFQKAFERVREFVEQMRSDGHPITVVDLGGGLGIPYDADHDSLPLPAHYGHMIERAMQGLDATFVFEPGRLIAGNAGILVSSVIYDKDASENHQFLIIDAGMNDLARPAMYDAHHEIVPVREGKYTHHYDVVGPVCESSDVFSRHTHLPALAEGDLVALRSSGAYGAVMGSTYNARPLAAEVLVDGDQFRVIRERASYEALMQAYGAL